MYSPENPLSRNWDRDFESLLPDCRLSGARRRSTSVAFGHMMMEKVFCGNCGTDGGLITADWAPHVFYLCDGCARALGPPPGCEEAEEQQIRGMNG